MLYPAVLRDALYPMPSNNVKCQKANVKWQMFGHYTKRASSSLIMTDYRFSETQKHQITQRLEHSQPCPRGTAGLRGPDYRIRAKADLSHKLITLWVRPPWQPG